MSYDRPRSDGCESADGDVRDQDRAGADCCTVLDHDRSMIPVIRLFEFSIRGDRAWIAVICENRRRTNENAIPKRSATVDKRVVLNFAICADYYIGVDVSAFAYDAVCANLSVLTHLHVVPDLDTASYDGRR